MGRGAQAAKGRATETIITLALAVDAPLGGATRTAGALLTFDGGGVCVRASGVVEQDWR